MNFTLILLATISINFIITIIFVYRTYKIMMELFCRQEKYNYEFKNDIKNIFAIIKFNGLVKPKTKEDK